MRILFITHVEVLDGANRSMMQLIEELRANHNVTPVVVCPCVGPKHKSLSVASVCAERGIECYEMPLVKFKLTKRTWIEKIKIFLGFIIRNVCLIYRLRKVQFDMVHSNSSVIDMGAYLAMARHKPHVWHLRELGYEDFRMVSVFGSGYERWIYSKCTRAIAISKVVERKFHPLFGDRLRLIYNGVVPKDESLSSQHRNDVLTFCITGRLEPNKNQLEVLKACAILKNGMHCSFKMLVVGTGVSNYVDMLKKYVSDNRLEDTVTFMGYRADVPQILQKCDVGLMASTNEAFGRVTVEYMMQNLAVIASNTGANPEIITDGETGLLYELGNVEQLADNMRLLMENRNVLLRIAATGKNHACRNFTSVKNSDNVYRLYLEIMGGRN